jgi:hypothetical protein
MLTIGPNTKCMDPRELRSCIVDCLRQAHTRVGLHHRVTLNLSARADPFMPCI